MVIDYFGKGKRSSTESKKGHKKERKRSTVVPSSFMESVVSDHMKARKRKR